MIARHRPPGRRRLALRLVPVLLFLAASSQAAPGGESPWSLLTELRSSLSRSGIQTMEFTQSYVPAGFHSGEEETGRVSLSLPTCLRWEYSEPYPKRFLLCDGTLWAWNPGEPSGQIFDLDAERQPGLDLLLLGVDRLRLRYSAEAEPRPEGGTVVRLLPSPGVTRELREAELVVSAEGDRLLELSYRDQEGNLTSFRFSPPESAPADGRFTPPDGVRWEREQPGDEPGGRV